MSSVLVGLLIVTGLVAAVVVVVAVPVLVTVIVRDIYKTEESAPAEAAPTTLSIAVKRGIARAFVVAGGAFWSVASFAGLYSFRQSGATSALVAALYPLAACAVTLVIGWYYERVMAILLVLAAQAVIVYGVLYQFELGVWVLMTITLLGPVLTAAVLFWLARGDQEAFELHHAMEPDLHLIFSARSSLALQPVEA